MVDDEMRRNLKCNINKLIRTKICNYHYWVDEDCDTKRVTKESRFGVLMTFCEDAWRDVTAKPNVFGIDPGWADV